MHADASGFFEATRKLRPANLEATRERLDAFVAAQIRDNRRCVLVTAGGTTVPLEIKTVRFIDNFSTGTRGALCAEEFLRKGYAVVLLYRPGCNFPFMTELHTAMRHDPVATIRSFQECKQQVSSDLPDLSRLLAVPFTTIFDYLFLLREACQALRPRGRAAMAFLSAAVSDFYLPEDELAVDKIQSRGCKEGLTMQLRNVPKLLGAVRTWGPEIFVVTFKLETNPSILEAKAAEAIRKYDIDVVCANLLQSYRDWVEIIRKAGPSSEVKCLASEIQGCETEPIPVTGVSIEHVARKDHSCVDVPLVAAVMKLHGEHVLVGDAPPEEPPLKRARQELEAAAVGGT